MVKKTSIICVRDRVTDPALVNTLVGPMPGLLLRLLQVLLVEHFDGDVIWRKNQKLSLTVSVFYFRETNDIA